MALIVQKFGGTSVGSIERIRDVAKIVKNELDNDNKVIVVASAMSGVTDHLIKLSLQVSNLETDDQRMEYDAIIATGEKVSSGILSLTLQSLGIKARSWQGWQIPILTDEFFTKGRIRSIDATTLLTSIANDEVPVITGFQGVFNDRVVTLGRGGSDTSAAAIAVASHADRCDIYTDVDGVYTADPRIVPNAHIHSYITFEEMLEMAAAGSKVLHMRAVEIAAKFKLKLRVLSSFSQAQGTEIVSKEVGMEGHQVTGIAIDKNISCWEVECPPDKQNHFVRLFEAFEKNALSLHQIIMVDGKALLVLPSMDSVRVGSVLTPLGYKPKELSSLAQVSVIGIGVKADSTILQKVFKILSVNGINILAANTSGIRISFLVPESQGDSAVICLHDGLGLENI